MYIAFYIFSKWNNVHANMNADLYIHWIWNDAKSSLSKFWTGKVIPRFSFNSPFWIYSYERYLNFESVLVLRKIIIIPLIVITVLIPKFYIYVDLWSYNFTKFESNQATASGIELLKFEPHKHITKKPSKIISLWKKTWSWFYMYSFTSWREIRSFSLY